jgi:Tfp pilus assembly protein PilX
MAVSRTLGRLRREEGVALPVAVMVLTLVLGMSGLVLLQAQRTGDSANRDRGVKSAVQAADAGLEVAMFRLRKVATSTDPCAGSGSYVVQGGEQWCPQVSEDLGDGAVYTYQVSAPDEGGQRTVVSTGTTGGQTRRVAVTTERTSVPLVYGYGVSSDDTITLNSSSEIGDSHARPPVVTNTRSNGDIIMNSSASICGNATPGPGRRVIGSGVQCDGITTPAVDRFTFDVIHNASAWTVNDNNRICKSSEDPCRHVSPALWDNPSRRFEMYSSGSLTLRGNTYAFCSMRLDSSSEIIFDPIDTSKPVRIYIGSPAQCAGQPDPVLQFNSSADLRAPAGKVVPVQIFVPESTTPTRVEFNSAFRAETPVALYAPSSTVELNSSTDYWGVIAGERVTMNSSSNVFYDSNVDVNPEGSGISRGATYRECRPQAGAGSPAAGC